LGINLLVAGTKTSALAVKARFFNRIGNREYRPSAVCSIFGRYSSDTWVGETDRTATRAITFFSIPSFPAGFENGQRADYANWHNAK
jgi:hypothetical protein